MAFWVLMGIIVVMVLVLLVQLFRKKPLKKLLLSYVAILGSYFFYVSYTCGSKNADVKVMMPQAEIITNYILENGIPESMMDIPNLPYKWTSCSKARDGTNVEWCYFDASKNKYSTRLYFVKDQYGADVSIKLYNKKSETGIYIKVIQLNNESFEIKDHFEPYSTKNNGICNPMKM